ncbi:MAG: hypothetical protein J6P09_05630 [Methanobrevibacter sp.]|nr:hypothetical protein [Methanobrevibacter sp.]MBO6274248.1 hypothetical protein [Methanobrevibacter sp.]
MTQSYKLKSKITTAIGGIATIITTLGVDQLEAIFPGYGKFIPAIVAIATWYTSQITENTRVEKAEKIAVENYQKQENYTEYDEIIGYDDPTTEDTEVVGENDDL